MLQLIIHGLSDYVFTQSDWIALNKGKQTLEGYIACAIHVILYTSMFLFLTTSWKALLVIGGFLDKGGIWHMDDCIYNNILTNLYNKHD